VQEEEGQGREGLDQMDSAFEASAIERNLVGKYREQKQELEGTEVFLLRLDHSWKIVNRRRRVGEED